MRILFIGDSWQGSNARSMRNALAQQPQITVSDVGPDHFLPNHRSLSLRIANRLLHPFQVKELEYTVLQAIGGFRPDVVVVYKGRGISAHLLKKIRAMELPIVNIFPDYSPHAYGRQLQEAIGSYDLVVSTKSFHPSRWQSVYGYSNPCVFVPHGYDPEVHLWTDPPQSQQYDVALCGTWRPEYQRLMRAFADSLADDRVSVAIAGSGWLAHRDQLPKHWRYVGPKNGRAYGDFLRSAAIAIAPVNRDVVIRGVKQPGDEDTARTYELAAAYCFFVHQRTDYVKSIYHEQDEVPLWSDGKELAKLVQHWLLDEPGRRLMASRAHARAVTAYSIPSRAASVLEHIGQLMNVKKDSGVNA